jgi:hypothetical protein
VLNEYHYVLVFRKLSEGAIIVDYKWVYKFEPLCFGMNLEKIKSMDQKYFEKQKGKFKLLERTYS